MQKSSLQVLRSSNDQDHADGNVEHRGIDVPKRPTVDKSNVICGNAPSARHGVA
jgi:hypothetical protein